ncbi:MAG TPA: 4-hydroxybenzoate octaprenyltransferase [Tepidisphaeraceae bacterium]|nr:4-hydroxybenzoate octaprenyltransferase [Tepidisphaeraceae bacterium]
MNTNDRTAAWTDTIHLRAGAFICRFRLFARDIKISHTIFALPWALLAGFVAAGGSPRPGQILLIVLCMVTARTVAMSSNRLLDAELDARNPRTAGRAIPSGQLSRGFYIAALSICGLAFIASTSMFQVVYGNILPLALSVPVLLFVAAYPLLKRFTKLCHYYLGAALALAPVCAWVAIAPKMDLTPFLMAAAVLLWTAGFDIIYACQDYHSDLQTGVVSVPARLGIGPALWVSRITHAGSFAAMLLLGLHEPQLGWLYLIGVGCAAGLLIFEHAIVSPDDLSRVGLAFFTINGIISLLVGSLGILDVFI